MVNICLLGATGSIGSQVLDIIKDNPNFTLTAFSFGSNVEKALEIIKEFKPVFVACNDRTAYVKIKEKYPSILLEYGTSGITNVATYKCENPMVINALVGSIGLIPTINAIDCKRNVLLANKETLVIGGELVMKRAQEKGVKIIPIDSEHSAIAQLLIGHNNEEVKKIIITASGGPFRTLNRNDLDKVTKEQALNHPNWKMGPKITIDSATMMNKGFEIIEAHHLFNLPMDKITTIIHPESIIHSMVEFVDNAIFAQMGSSDMHLPIQYAINYPKHEKCDIIKPLDLIEVNALHFEKMDEERFPLIKLAYDAIEKGGIYPTVLNASNEIAVTLFLNDKIAFNDIEKIIILEYNNPIYEKYNQGELNILKIMNIDEEIKNKIRRAYNF